MPDNDTLPPLPKGYVAISDDSDIPPLPKGYIDIKKKVGSSGNGIGSVTISEPPSQFANAKRPTNVLPVTDLGYAQTINATKRDLTSEAANDYVQQSVASAEQSREDKKWDAATNSALIYFKNNPSLLGRQQVKKVSKTFKDVTTAKSTNIDYLKKQTPFQTKVAQLKADIDEGKLITYQTEEGEYRAAYPMEGIRNTVETFKQAWNASGEAEKVLQMNDEEFKKYATTTTPDETFLPTKANLEPSLSNISGTIGGNAPVLIRAGAGAAAGATMALASEVTGGMSLAGLAPIMAWAMTAPDIANQQAAQGKIKSYRDALNQGYSEEQALNIAKNVSVAEYAKGMVEGTALNLVPAGVPKNIGQGVLKAVTEFSAKQPYIAGGVGLAAGSLTSLKNAYAEHLGLTIDEAEKSKEFNEAFNNMAGMQLAFNIAHGIIAAPGYVKAQSLNALSKIPPETRQQLSQQAVEQGWITEEQALAANKNVMDFEAAKETIIPSGVEEKDAVIAGLIQKRKNLEEAKKNVDAAYHPEIDAQIEAANRRIQLAKDSDNPIRYAETDDVEGATNFTTKAFEDLTRQEKNNIDVPKEFGVTVIKPTENERFVATIESDGKITKVEGDFASKEGAEKAADDILKQEYYDNELSAIEKPELRTVPKKEGEAQTEITTKEGDAGVAAVDEPTGKPTIETIKEQENVGEVIQPQQEEVSHVENIKAKFKEQFKAKGVGEEEIDASIALMDARAKSWASEEEGRTPEQWYDRIADVKSGEFQETTVKQFQLPNGTKVTGVNMPEVTNGFYSPLEKTIAETKLEKLPAKQWIEKFGKGEEAKWTGLTEWLSKQEGSVSKKDIQQFLKENRIEVVEVVKGGETSGLKELQAKYEKTRKERKALSEKYKDSDVDAPQRDIEKMVELGDRLESIERQMRELDRANETKFNQYQLEGQKENYKEVLVTMPSASRKFSQSMFEKYGEDWVNKMTPKEEKMKWELFDKKNTYFQSSHFDEPNILVHLRMNTRIDAEGKKVLFIEETQSDFGQQGKKEGFAISQKEADDIVNANGEKLQKDGIVSVRGGGNHLHFEKFENGKWEYKYPEDVSETQAKLMNESLKALEDTKKRTPQAPFVTDTNSWTKLGLKVALKEAVKQKADKIAWTTGEQQNSRYDLSKTVSDVYYNEGEKHLTALKDGKLLINEPDVSPQKLADYIGKDVAEKLLAKNEFSDNRGTKHLHGDDLKIGGTGMKGFYGSPKENKLGIVGNVAKSLFKQEPKTTEISINDISKITESQPKEGEVRVTETKDGDWTVTMKMSNGEYNQERFKTEVAARDRADEILKRPRTTSTQHSITITPELRKQAEEGQPLFQRDKEGKPKGAVETLADGKVVIHALNSPDVSTMVHEISHVFEKDLTAAEQKVVKDFGGSEAFARGFERYLRNGIAPTKELLPLFQKFRTWLMDIYQSIVGTPIEKRISPEIKKIFDRLLTEKDITSQYGTEKAARTSEIKINSEKVQYNGQDAIGNRSRPKSETDAARKQAKEKIANPSTNASLKAANSYNESVGLPKVEPHTYKKSSPEQQKPIGELYPKLQDVNSPTYKETQLERDIYNGYKAKYPEIFEQNNIKDYKDLVNKSYQQLINEVELQYDKLPVKVTFHEGDKNYENSSEMLDDVHNFNHLYVFKGGDDHTALGEKTRDENGLTANDKFRAVHDYFGHSVEGYQFGKDGEENAWIEHSKMFSPLAQWALSSETRGQNSFVNYSGINEVPLAKIKLGATLKREGAKQGNKEMIAEGERLLEEANTEFKYAEQKAIILPQEHSDVSKFHKTQIKNIPEKLKSKQDAIQKQSADALDVRKQTTDGEGVGARNTKPEIVAEQKEETPKPAKDKDIPLDESIHAERPKTILTHKGLQEIATETGLEDITPRERESRLRQLKEANDIIDEWKDKGTYTKEINDVVDRAKKGKIDEVEQKILANHIATLREQLRRIGQKGGKGVDSQEFKDKFEELANVVEAGKVMRSKAGGLLGDKAIGIPDDTLEGYLMQEKEINKGAPLTDNQIKTAVNEYENISAASTDFKKKYEDLQADYAKLLAEREVKKQAASTKKNPKKTHEDYVKDRQSILNSAREKIAKARAAAQDPNAPKTQGIGGRTKVDDLITIAPEVAKLTKSYIEEGISKFEDVVKNIYNEFKQDIPDITEKDVVDIFAGVYNEKKKTRSQLAEQAYNIKIQAQLINKYEAMLKGEQPKKEKAKIKFNQEIHDLRQKIKDLEKEEAEANTFFGESDAGNRRIEKLEDELQRLKDRRPKEPTQKEEREISEREKELKEQIAAERKAIAAEEREFNKRSKEEFDPEIKKLQALKKRNETELKKIQAQLDKGDFAIPPKKVALSVNSELKKNFPQAYREALESKSKLIKAKRERDLRRAEQQFKNLDDREKFRKSAARWLNVPRTLMASYDFSAPLRQAAVATVAHPRTAVKAFVQMFKHGFSQKEYDRWFDELQESPNYDLYKESDLPVTDPYGLHLEKAEEDFLGGNIGEKIPIIGRGVKASERAYVSYLNKMRVDLFDRYAEQFMANGQTFQNSPELYKALGRFIGQSTGRGKLGGNKLEAAAPILNSLLFSPRLIASRINLLTNWANPNFYKKVPYEVRKLYFQDMAKFIGVGITTLALAKQLGAEVSLDPRSSDFGKIKIGNTRYDIWGGFQQYIRVFAQLLSGQRKTELGIKDIDKTFGESRADVAGSFARGKLAPVPAMIMDIAAGRTSAGEKVNRNFDFPNAENETSFTEMAITHLSPLLIQDVIKASKEDGIKAIFTTGVPAMFGIGVQNYEPSKTARQFDLKDTDWQFLLQKTGKLPLLSETQVEIVDENGKRRAMTSEEFKKFTEIRNQKIKESIQGLRENGALLEDADGNVTEVKAAKDMTNKEVSQWLNAISAKATAETKSEIFGDNEDLDKIKIINNE